MRTVIMNLLSHRSPTLAAGLVAGLALAFASVSPAWAEDEEAETHDTVTLFDGKLKTLTGGAIGEQNYDGVSYKGRNVGPRIMVLA